MILNKAKTDSYFRTHFAKDSLKQNIIEKTVANHIKQIIGVTEFKKLNNSSKNSIYLNSGQISSYHKDVTVTKETKSIHLKWNIETLKNKKLECYTYHKYINESGRAQDNQYRDVVNNIKNSPSNSTEKNYFLLFVMVTTLLKKIKRIRKKEKNNSCCFILKTNNLEKKIKYLKNNY